MEMRVVASARVPVEQLTQLVPVPAAVYVPTRVLLDSDAQPLMLGKAACISLGIRSSTDDTPVYEEVEEIVRLAAAVSSSLDVPLWNSCQALQLEADRLVKKAWNEASLPAEPERDSADQLVCGSSALSPLVTIHIAWEYSL
ncbi:hypothetical protein AXG93_3457s1060 [Marchantia polymorpha subsp. ruderalis]|uniref:Uncharacterized protein n=1 Tax=Marchantia polymorpha subsp. ruderalis TaxID=1480154 RepID=A0A176W167_MARPO|nr:hypothetical protein AXG93_3457s1060 [Marchantia polymorpha subsp. ruderalis]